MVAPYLEGVLRRDRTTVLLGLVLLTSLSWLYLILDAIRMTGMDSSPSQGMGMVQPHLAAWDLWQISLVFLMWAVMMIGMMVPSAAPMVLLFAGLQRRRRQLEKPFVPTGIFLAGYLAAWTLFSLMATLAQWGLHSAALLSPMMMTTSPYLGAGVLLAAGMFQWTPWKHSCLNHCRSPIQFLASHWREGRWGAWRMGLSHGAYCVGCCWFLMLLLFVTGVMNLFWVAIIAGFVLVEKAAPQAASRWVSRVSGAGLAAWGLAVLFLALEQFT